MRRPSTPMKIYGVDFTSAPKPSKPLTLARCLLEGETLRVLRLEKLVSFAEFEQVLAGPGPWAMGIDCPFGQPRRLIQDLAWPSDWRRYVDLIESMGKEAFEKTLRNYGKRLYRCTDRLSRSRSPMQLDFIPVGKMFFQAAPMLLRSGATIIPCLPGDPHRLVVEAYPKLVVKALNGNAPYKSDTKKKQSLEHIGVRRQVVERIASHETYGFRVEWTDSLAAQAIDDPSGDILDAVLCAMQTAWAWQQRGNGYGVPQDCDPAEGWIIDPANWWRRGRPDARTR